MRHWELFLLPEGANEELRILYTVYSPAEHKPDTVHVTKEEGDKEEEDGIDEAPQWSQKSKKENEKAGLVEAE